jgi:hypothetical protein
MNTSELIGARLWDQNAKQPAPESVVVGTFIPQSEGTELVNIYCDELRICCIKIGTHQVFTGHAPFADLPFASELAELGVFPLGPHRAGQIITVYFIVGEKPSDPNVAIILRSPLQRQLPPDAPSRLEDGATKLLETVARVLEAKP